MTSGGQALKQQAYHKCTIFQVFEQVKSEMLVDLYKTPVC